MRTTLNIDDDLLDEARRVTGIETKTALVEAGLRALLEKAARKRISALYGKVAEASAPYRRRSPRSGK